MCTVRKSVLIWSLYFSSSSKNVKKVWFSSVSCAYMHGPLLLQACYRLVHWRQYNTGKSGRSEHGKAGQQCIVLMTPRESRERTRRTGDETGPVTLVQKCLRYKNNKKKNVTIPWAYGKALLTPVRRALNIFASISPFLKNAFQKIKKTIKTWDQLVTCSNNKEKPLTALKKRS